MGNKAHSLLSTIKWEDLSVAGRDQLLKKRGVMALGRILLFAAILFIVILFLPWRQTIPGRGTVTALKPEERPQTIQNQIGGRIEHWAVQDGDEVQAGDTILVISETAPSYFDPELPQRLNEQLTAKKSSEQAADQKMLATKAQIDALTAGLRYQLEAARNKVVQARNVVKIDSADLVAMQSFYETSKARLLRYEQGYKNGLFSLTDIETRRLNLQNDEAKVVSAQNKLTNARQTLINATIDLDNIQAKYNESLAKAQSDLGSALSSKASAQGDIAKLRNEIANIEVRRDHYVVRAPQSGYIVKTLKAGIGENIKEGESIATLQPKVTVMAVELYVDAMDVPLILSESDTRLQFEGWPSVQFSGWPSVAVGTFAGKVAVIDKVSSADGKYRLLIKPTTPVPDKDEPWPEQLRLGSGAFGRVILNAVPLWYEIWRQLNGFPPSLEKEPKTEGK
ncbi:MULTISPECIES: HlyD family secretion protein [Olivibacter]|jgi:multidrug efflux pump subunit AcrA (membrane-fusion protein)|uniref:HlyD family secretion protein n=2 Tax=Olivibacter TaxID=376469 RepID=A0ABV6HSV6_9SPHI|nr:MULTISPECIES: biotin/lipoyl-binding protein [Olivibacter]MCL4640879.1 HlyD family secretion protein [Olivibacter sp. UJ_SKK_5.1]MDM8174392.1 biotin/lipoyl-binding protein [Olivibacter sp. 47]MDX3916647.1 biotin/lipoyl-binding protein [Pseudosphingobacterium sp.]QEL01266.1 biotin/lipoyl-binding protein [Olivibacter sp. LS-1]